MKMTNFGDLNNDFDDFGVEFWFLGPFLAFVNF